MTLCYALAPDSPPELIALAQQYGIPLHTQPDTRYHVRWHAGNIELVPLYAYRNKPLRIDFLHGKTHYRRQHGGGRRQLIAKAVGIKPHKTLHVLDATAGLAEDAYVLACLGCHVTLLERSAALVILLNNAIARAHGDPVIARLQIQHTQAQHYLSALTPAQRPEVIYLDPMYPTSNAQALAKKSMCILRDLVGDDSDAAALLPLALTRATQRVVVKRPRHGVPLNDQVPTFTYSGQASRFDIYLVAQTGITKRS